MRIRAAIKDAGPHNSFWISATAIEAHAMTSAARTGGGDNQATIERRDECLIDGL